MRTAGVIITLGGLVLCAAAPARAEDAYCDYVENVAAAESATLFAPELFASFGYVDQAGTIDIPDSTSDDLRVTAGLRVGLSRMYQGLLTRKRATADCRRNTALGQVQGETTYRALEARARVLEDALDQAEKILAEADADLDARRATAQEVFATRLRVDQLREQAAATRRALDELPKPAEGRSMAGALAAYYDADADVESADASLRRARAWDLSVRFGYDKFLEADDESPYFAVLQLNVNLGVVFQGKANREAAAARRRLVREEAGGQVKSTTTRLQALLAIEKQREAETAVLVEDLEQQLKALRRLGGDARRLRDTVWFEWVKARAEHEYFAAHVASLSAILGAEE